MGNVPNRRVQPSQKPVPVRHHFYQDTSEWLHLFRNFDRVFTVTGILKSIREQKKTYEN